MFFKYENHVNIDDLKSEYDFIHVKSDYIFILNILDVLNPKAGRYVSKTGKIGQELLKQQKENNAEKKCSETKIKNVNNKNYAMKNQVDALKTKRQLQKKKNLKKEEP